MSEQPEISNSDIKKTYNLNPTKTVSRSTNFGTVVADHAIVTLSEDTQLCTFTFFQTHSIPKIDERGITIDSIEAELIMEVKMPFSTAFAVSMYMKAMLKQFQSYQGKPHKFGTYFGPTAVVNTPKADETKKP